MSRSLNAQTWGSLAVFGAFAASEGAAHYLHFSPSSPFAWYLNLQLFRPFEAARVAASPLHVLSGPHALEGFGILLALIVMSRLARIRLAVALFSNLALIAAVMLSYAWFWLPGHSRLASIAAPHFQDVSDLLLCGLLAVSLLTCVLSHVGFISAISRGEQP